MRIRPKHRKILNYYLTEFYKRYPSEKFTLFHFVRFFKSRLKKKKDAWMGVAGDTGTGKSLFVIMTQILFGRPMSMTGNIAYIPKGTEIIDMFNKLRFQTLLIDEAARQMRKVNWQDKQQQMVNMAAMTERFKENWVFLNMPNFNEFTKSMRLTNIIFRCIILYRTDTYARVIVQRKSRNWRSEDPWSDQQANEMYKKIEKRNKELTNEDLLLVERRFPNTIMDFIVPNLEIILPDVTTCYEQLKSESRETAKISDQALALGKDKFKQKYISLMNKVTKLLVNNELDLGKLQPSKKAMASALGVSVDTYNRYLRLPREGDSKIVINKDIHTVRAKISDELEFH